MKRGILFLVFSLLAAAAHAGSFWDSLWHNADQQGERLMQQGDAAAAAQAYRDPRRKAYAELQAGDYTNAAKHFSAFDDSNGNYNRGNALAQAGQLEDALKAYDAALAQDPNDKDAQHNRDLVAKALQQQPPQQQASSDKDSSSKDGDKKQSGQSDDKNGGKQNETRNDPGKQDSSVQNQGDKQQQDKTGQGKEENKDEQQTEQGQQQSAENKQPNSNQPDMSGQKEQALANDAEQAKRDAAAALDKTPADKASAPADAPLSEKQLAQEKWLRAIPDDPGGLLRRKFMIEHMIRQQGGQQ